MTRKINIKLPKEETKLSFSRKAKSINELWEHMCLGKLAGMRIIQRKWKIDGLLQCFSFYKNIKGLARQAVRKAFPPLLLRPKLEAAKPLICNPQFYGAFFTVQATQIGHTNSFEPDKEPIQQILESSPTSAPAG